MPHRVLKIIDLLSQDYPDARTALNYNNPLELLVATILSAQCTDKKVNEVTQALFQKYKTVRDYAEAPLEELQQDIRQTGFYRNKAKNIKSMAQLLLEEFDSQVPRTMAELVTLPGVQRKTANVVLSNAYGVIEGIAVDTHVRRLSQRLGLTQNKDPQKIEKDLMKIVPEVDWHRITDLLIWHGRAICKAQKPDCSHCSLNELCPEVFLS